MSWLGKVAALWFGLIDLLGSVNENSCFGKYWSVEALVAGMVFFGVAGVSEKFAVVTWSTGVHYRMNS